jgi:hypothetical protein
MAITSAQAIYSLTGTGALSRSGVSGNGIVGSAATIQLPSSTIGYCVRAIIADSASDFVLDLATGDTTGTDTFVPGTQQVETATITAAAGATSNGTMTLVLTSAGMAGSPLNIPVTLTTAMNTAALVATAARAALTANATVAARFNIAGGGASIVLSRKANTISDVELYYANDTTLNLAIPSGLGITAAPSSANTTPGVASSGVKLYDEHVDFEGRAIGTIEVIQGVLIESSGDSNFRINTSGEIHTYAVGEKVLRVSSNVANGVYYDNTAWIMTGVAGAVELTMTVVGAEPV